MGLRDEWESEDTGNAAKKDCRVWKWLGTFDDDDRGFLLDKLGNRDVSSAGFVAWLKRKDIPVAYIGYINDHRARRCTCPDEYGGRIA